nr:reverse transcriptase domain-containing protein [Tanacetum cinerariifolium]
MTSLADKAILLGANNRPPMLEKDMYESWKSQMELYMLNRQHGRMILESVENGPLLWLTVEKDGVTRLKKYSELSAAEAVQADCDVKATNIILQGLPPKVYAWVSTHKEDPPEDPPEILMADNRTMAELLQAPTEGYEDAIFFPPSKTTNLRNEITRFQQRFDESFYEALDRFNDLLRACPHHGFSELHQLDTFYNALNVNDHDSLNSAAGGNFLDKMPRECLKIIESKSKVRQSRAKAAVAKVSTSSSTPAISSEVSELKDMVRALLLDKKNQSLAPASSSTPAPVKAVEPNYVTCG